LFLYLGDLSENAKILKPIESSLSTKMFAEVLHPIKYSINSVESNFAFSKILKPLSEYKYTSNFSVVKSPTDFI